MHNQSQSTCVPKEDFSSLSPEVRQIWIKILNDIKSVTLRSRTGNHNEGVNKHSKDIHKTIKPPSSPSSKFCLRVLSERSRPKSKNASNSGAEN